MNNKKLSIFRIAQTSILVLSLLGITILLFRQEEANRLARNRLVEEVRSNSESIDSLRSGLLQFTEDTGEIRDSLNLPRREYSFLPEQTAEGGSAGSSNPFAPYFSAIDALVRENRENRSYREVNAFLERPVVWEFLTREGIVAEPGSGGGYTLAVDERVFATIRAADKGDFTVSFAENPEERTVESAEGFITLLAERAEREEARQAAVADAAEELRGVRRNQESRALLERYDLYFGSVSSTDSGVELPIFKGRNEPIFSISWSEDERRFFVGADAVARESGIIGAVRKHLSEADLRTDRERQVDRRVAEIRELSEDEGFRAYLESLDLTISEQPREGEEYVYFDLESSGGDPVGSLGIQRLNGTVWIMDEDDVPLSSLRRLRDNAEPETTSNRRLGQEVPTVTGLFNPEGQETYLILGSHERMADTVVLAHVNHEGRTVQLVSVPRDLYYRGRKINVLYPNYGGPRFAEELSQITGLNIAGYVAVDMYAFIDVVNILGGIEVTLREPLIDPTYRTKDNGRWSTLYYPAGTHHLSGIEALRLARSRHTSSDFGRAERQQAILSSLKEKFSRVGEQGLGTIYELVGSLLRYVESDLSSYELARLLHEARSYQITDQLVLNTDNILYHTYSNLYYSGKSKEEVDEDFYLGAWILLPKEDDWNALRWYIRRALSEEAV
mgnify:CR=1 FL=1